MANIYLFNVNMMKAGQIISVGNELGHNVRVISEDLFELPIGAVSLGIKEHTPKDRSKKLPGEIMLFGGFNDSTLDAFLEKYNEAGIEKIKNKAILTPQNFKLNAFALYDELEEHSKNL